MPLESISRTQRSVKHYLEEKGFSAELVNPLSEQEIPGVVHVRPV